MQESKERLLTAARRSGMDVKETVKEYKDRKAKMYKESWKEKVLQGHKDRIPRNRTSSTVRTTMGQDSSVNGTKERRLLVRKGGNGKRRALIGRQKLSS